MKLLQSNMEFRHRLTFGKYSGEKLEAVMVKDLNYVKWLMHEGVITMAENTKSVFNVLIKRG